MSKKIGFILSLILFILFFSGKSFLHPYSFPKLFNFPIMPEAEDNPVTVEGVELGRFLFYDPILSVDSQMACSNCHKQEYAFSDAPNQFSNGRNSVKMKRNTPPLFNLAWFPKLFWDGRTASIESQVFHPITESNEMGNKTGILVTRLKNNSFYRKKFSLAFGQKTIDSAQIAKALGQFLRTLLSYRSKYDRALTGKQKLSKEEVEGFFLVNDQSKGNCIHCHNTDGNALGTLAQFSNNGLDTASNPLSFYDPGLGLISGKLSDYGKFKIPSIRNIAITGPYMHDGRFFSLEQVIKHYESGLKKSYTIDSKLIFDYKHGNALSPKEQSMVLAFLLTLTDSVFIRDPAHSNPFTNLK